MKRRADHPELHVYRSPYEPSAMKRLMGAHHTREHEVDELLRGEVFVDLYAVVRAGVRIGTESYSLKQVEKLYMQRPAGEVMDGGGSIVAYEQYLEHREQKTLDEIEEYNEDDCQSTLGLRDWLQCLGIIDVADHRGLAPRVRLSRTRAVDDRCRRGHREQNVAGAVRPDMKGLCSEHDAQRVEERVENSDLVSARRQTIDLKLPEGISLGRSC
jgi:hypothetical protein